MKCRLSCTFSRDGWWWPMQFRRKSYVCCISSALLTTSGCPSSSALWSDFLCVGLLVSLHFLCTRLFFGPSEDVCNWRRQVDYESCRYVYAALFTCSAFFVLNFVFSPHTKM